MRFRGNPAQRDGSDSTCSGAYRSLGASIAAIRALPAGSTLWIDGRGVGEPKQYHSIAKSIAMPRNRSASVSNEEVQAYVRGALLDSVSHHLVADVPVGAFLSAGIDSGALVGLMRDAGHQAIQTMTVAFEEFQRRLEDESKLAAEVASPVQDTPCHARSHSAGVLRRAAAPSTRWISPPSTASIPGSCPRRHVSSG